MYSEPVMEAMHRAFKQYLIGLQFDSPKERTRIERVDGRSSIQPRGLTRRRKFAESASSIAKLYEVKGATLRWLLL